MAQNWYGAGELWKKEVKSVRANAETRKEFYGDKALRKVGGKLLGDVSSLSVDDLTAKLKEHAEITKDDKILAEKWDPEKIRSKRYISDILKDFFEQKCGSKRGSADALIALKFLNAELENVDLVREGETIDIENGILTIKSRGEVVARGAIITRGILPPGSPDALPRRTAVRRKSRSARAAVAASLPEPPKTLGPTGASIVPEPAGPSVAPPLAPPAVAFAPPPAPPVAPALSAPPGITRVAPPVAPPSTVPLPPLAVKGKRSAARAMVAPPPLPAAPPAVAVKRSLAPPETPEALEAKLKKRAREIEDALKAEPQLKSLAHEIKLVDAIGPNVDFKYFKIILQGNTGAPLSIGFFGVLKKDPQRVVLENNRHIQLGSFDNNPGFAQFAADPKNLTWGGIEYLPGTVPPDTLPTLTVAPRKNPAEQLKETIAAIQKIKIPNHTIRKTTSFGGEKVDKDTIAYEVKDHRTKQTVAVFDFQKAHPDSIELFFVKGKKDFEPGISGLAVAEVEQRLSARLNPPPAPPPKAPLLAPSPAPPTAPARPSPAPPGAIPPSATINPFADIDAKAAAAPPNPADDPDKISVIVDGAWKAKKWGDLDVATHLLLTNPKSTVEQRANAYLRLIDAYKAQNKVDQAIESYTVYMRLKPQEVGKGVEGVRYAFENKKYEEALVIQLNVDLSRATDIQKKALNEVAGDSAYELKKYPAAKFYWERSLNLYTPTDPERQRLQAKIDKLPKGP